MNASRTSPTRVAVCGAATDERALLTPRLESEGFEVVVLDEPDLSASELVRCLPHVVIVGTGADLENRITLVKQLRGSVRANSVRILWLLRPDAPSSAELAMQAGADDLATWSGQLDGLVARIREQAAASSLRRVAEREAAIRAELARVDEALNRAVAEQDELRAQLVDPPPGPYQPPSEPVLRTDRSRALHFEPLMADVPLDQHPTLELSTLERRVVDLLRSHPAGQRANQPLSVLVIGIDGWTELVSRRGGQLARRLRDAVADLIESLVDDPIVIEALPDGQICVLYPEAGEALAVRLARDVCAQVASAPVKTAPRPLQPTVSVGLATLEPDHRGSPFDLLEQAGRALKVARRRGGNRWWVYHRSHTD